MRSAYSKSVVAFSLVFFSKSAGDDRRPPSTTTTTTALSLLLLSFSSLPPSLSLSNTTTKTPGANNNTNIPAGKTPGPAPPSGASLSNANKKLVPIQALNPYQSGWTVRAKVSSKGQLRTAGAAGTSVLSAELVDAHGTAIEATFWRESATQAEASLEVGSVYLFSRGRVKPANKAYSNVRNDYCLDFGQGALFELAPDQGDAADMSSKLSYVSIDRLFSHVGKKAPVDVLGLALDVAALGSVKRKSDETELARRDVTLLDASGKTVTLTLWGKHAEEEGAALEQAKNGGGSGEVDGAAGTPCCPPVLSVSHCRVGDYNGEDGIWCCFERRREKERGKKRRREKEEQRKEKKKTDSFGEKKKKKKNSKSQNLLPLFSGVSLSALGRSVVAVDPTDSPQADALRLWWEEEGKDCTPSAAGEAALAATGKSLSSNGPRPRADLSSLLPIPGEPLPPPEAKPEYATVVATLAAVDPEQTMWYAAAPEERGRKVVERDGGWWCEFDQRLYPTMVRRYVLQSKVADSTGEAQLSFFDDAARVVLGGKTADELAEMKENRPKAFAAALAEAAFRPWVLRVAARTQEYNGERRRRLAVHSAVPLDYGAEARRTLAALGSMEAVKAEAVAV